MELKNIEEHICPDCGAGTKEERKVCQHVNGHWNEHRVFHCGKELHFSPNFMRVVHEGECQRTPKYIARHKREQRFKRKIELVIENGKGVSTKFRARLLTAINHI